MEGKQNYAGGRLNSDQKNVKQGTVTKLKRTL